MVNNEANNTPDNTALNEERLEPTDKKTNTDESISSIYIEDQCTLDLGAVGKGIACDVAQNYLKQQKEVSGAVIAVGGSILLYGSKVDGTNWNVAVQNPRGKDGEAMGVLSLSGTTNVSTSGDYEKYFMQNGKRYHHILRFFNRLSSRKQSDLCNSSKRQWLTLRRSFHRLFCPRQRKRPKTFRNLRSRRHFHRPE